MTGRMKTQGKGRDMVRYQPAPLPARQQPASFGLGRLANVCGRAVNSVPKPVRQITVGSARIATKSILAILLLVLLAFGGLYGALTQGPISMSFLVAPIERVVNASMSGFRFDIGDAVLRRADDSYGIEFRLADVRVVDASGGRIVEAPLASADLSLPALLSGRLAPGQVDLIGPRLFLHYSEEKGLAVSAATDARIAKGDLALPPEAASPSRNARDSRSPAQAPATGARERPRPSDAAPPAPPLNLTSVLNDLFAQMRRGESAYLTSFGIRDAIVFFDRGEHITRWDVPNVAIDLAHERKNSAVLGEFTIRSGAASWQVKFRAGQDRSNGELGLTVSVDDVNPRLLATEFPQLTTLKIWDMPVDLAADFELAAQGDVLKADVQATLRPGLLYMPWDDKHPSGIDHGNFRLTYSREEGRIEIRPSEVRWGASQIKFNGTAQRKQATGRWDFQILTNDVMLGAEEFGVPVIPIDRLLTQGSYDPQNKALNIDRLYVQAADAQINVSASIRPGKESPAIQLNGSFSPMPVAFFKIVWPKMMLAGAREWIGSHISSGRIANGSVKLNIPDGMLAKVPDGGEIPPEAVDLRLDLENLVVRYWGELPVMQTTKSTATVSGHKFFYAVPDASVTLPSGNRVQLTAGEFIIGDLRPKVPNAEIHFKTQSDARAAFEFLDHEPLFYIQKLKAKAPQVDAPLTTTFSMSLPLLKEVRFADLRMNGRAHLQDVRATDLPGGMGIHGGTMDFDISESAIEARGDVKMNGMPVKIAWQRIYDAPADRQPPLRLRAIIDEAARQEMGLEVNHVLRGPVASELTLTMRKDQPPLIRFEANLADADVIMGSMGWRKPPGQRAMLTTDIEPTDNGNIVLRNLNLAGDDIAVRGELTLNDKKQPTAFRLPTLSLNLQTQMELTGELSNNVWKVRGSGSSYDGRQFFRSLFSAGKITEDQPQLPKNTPGVDIKLDLDNVFGFFDTTVKKVTLEARRRNDKLVYLDLHGRLNGKEPVAARLDAKPGEARTLLAEATDGGAAFRLVGFYPSARGGEVSLKVNLDGSGAAEKYGVLYARNFVIVGDQIVGEVLSGPKGQRATTRTRPAAEYGQQLEFENLRVPFSVGAGQFVVHDGIINGPMLGATMRGNIDFRRERISLSGTYVPLFGLNAAISGVPIIGDLLSGRHGEGIFGITFAVQGATSNPNVLVNPMSVVAPGFLRQLFEFDQTVPHIIPPERRTPEKSSSNSRASSSPPATR
jgi:hypothetical protein